MTDNILHADKSLIGNERTYKPLRRLGGGKYGEVWMAEVVSGTTHPPGTEVAVKVENRGLTREEDVQFWSEIEVLRALQRYEEEYNLQVEGHSLVPTVLDYRDDGDPKFFVQTLAEGEPLGDLLMVKGTLPEPQALTIVGQFCRVLEALHEGVERSYLDFQSGNIFWNEETERITVIDWNLLSKRWEMDRQSDVQAAARVLYRALMGVQPPEAGSVRALSRPAEQWARLSLGAQEVLRKAFRPAMEKRYSTAQALREDVENLRTLWTSWVENPEKFVSGAEAFLSGVIPAGDGEKKLDKTQREQVRSAAKTASIAAVGKPPEELAWQVEQLRERVEAWLQGRGALETGKRFFESLSYDEAAASFAEALEEAWDGATALEVVRWQQVTGATRTMRYNGKQRGDVTEALAQVKEGQYKTALNMLRPLPGHGGIETVEREIEIREALRQAEGLVAKQEYRKAAEEYGQAQKLLALQPDVYARLLVEELGDLGQMATKMEERAAEYGAVREKIERIDNSFGKGFSEGWKTLREEFDREPGHEALVAAAQTWAGAYLDERHYHRARAVAALGLDYTWQEQQRADLHNYWWVAEQLYGVQEAWDHHRLPEFKRRATELKRMYVAPRVGPSGGGKEPDPRQGKTEMSEGTASPDAGNKEGDSPEERNPAPSSHTTASVQHTEEHPPPTSTGHTGHSSGAQTFGDRGE